MKKLLLAIVFMVQCFLVKAQTTLSEAVDFECSDIDGGTIHLYEILDRGKTVLIDFFSAECGGCQQTLSPIVEAFPYYGCNLHDLFVMGISYIDNDSILAQWRDDNGVEMPIIGKDGGGNAVFSAYKIRVCPSIILIAPDRTVTIKSMYPFSFDDLVNQLTPHDIFPSDCTVEVCEAPFDLTATFTEDAVTLFWNESSTAVRFAIYRNGEMIDYADDTFYIDENLREEHVYCYYVKAICENEEESPKSNLACVNIPISDTNEYRKDAFFLYPNPTTDKVIVRGHGLEGVKVFNLMGQLIYDIEAQRDYCKLDFSNHKSGVYVVYMFSGSYSTTHRVVVIK